MFLRPQEYALIKSDFQRFLNSAECTDIEVHYRIPVNPVLNAAYGVTTADSWKDKKETARASQKIITPRDEDILSWGIIVAGDCIFYLTEFLDLSFIEYDSAYIVAGKVSWTPVPPKFVEFYNHLAFRLGNSQVAQAIPCRLKK